MKRILTATALMTAIATGAVAQDGYTTNTINRYLPEVDVSTLSDEQVAVLIGITGSADEADKEKEMRAYLEEFKSSTPPVVLSEDATVTPVEGEYFANTIETYVPSIDATQLSEEETAALISIATSGDKESIKRAQMRDYLGLNES